MMVLLHILFFKQRRIEGTGIFDWESEKVPPAVAPRVWLVIVFGLLLYLFPFDMFALFVLL